MIESDLARQVLLGVVALVFVAVGVRTLVAPAAAAADLGFSVNGANGHSELYAVYVGVWPATGVLAILAAVRVDTAILGDIVAGLVLAQPAARVIALARFGRPRGSLLAFFILEAVGGLLLLAVRPSG